MEQNNQTFLIPRLQQVMQLGIMVDCYSQDFPKEICGIDRILPCYYLMLTHQGTAQVVYDSQEATLTANMVVLVNPGHLVRFIDRSDDYVFSRLVITPQLFQEMLTVVSYHNASTYHLRPEYMLTDEQMERFMQVMNLIETIAQYSEQELPQKHPLLLAQLAVGYELLNLYRNEQDKGHTASRQTELLNRFCDLVVAHHRESREVKFYANLMNLTPKHLAKVVRSATGGVAPGEWIEQYVITQAKQLLEYYKSASLKQIAYMLGFTEPTSFYRYFRHATGMTAKQYRDSLA